MPNKISFSFPPSSLNTEEGRELYSFLYQTIEQLNVCLGAIDTEQISGAMAGALQSIGGLSKDISKVGSSANEALVNAIKAVNDRSEQADTQMRMDYAAADQSVKDEMDGKIAEAVEQLNGSIAGDKQELIGIIGEVDGRLSGETEALRGNIADINGAYEALEARVAALEAGNAV